MSAKDDQERMFTLGECLRADKQGYADGYLAGVFAFEQHLRHGMDWRTVYRRLRNFASGLLREWAEHGNGDVNDLPPVPRW